MSRRALIGYFVFAAIVIGGVLYVVNVRQDECFASGGHVKSVGMAWLCLTPDGRVM
jgi:hypothetical protein